MTDDLKSIDLSRLRPIFADQPTASLSPMIDQGRTLRRKVDRRHFITIRNSGRAAQQIGRLPGPGEVLHLLLRANAFSCFDILPAMIELAGRPADEVVLASLGINERHAESLDRLAEAGSIQNVRMILSHYFRSVDPRPYKVTAEIFRKRGWKLTVARSHVKLIAARFGQDHYVAAGSGNLRSCRSVENMDVSNDPTLFRWYADFVAEMLGEKT